MTVKEQMDKIVRSYRGRTLELFIEEELDVELSKFQRFLIKTFFNGKMKVVEKDEVV